MDIGYIRTSRAIKHNPTQLLGLNLTRIYADSCSLRDEVQPAKKRMLEEVREGDVIHVESLDRIVLDLPDLLSLVEQLGKVGVGLVFHTEHITIPGDINDPARENAIKSIKILSLSTESAKKERKDHAVGARRIGTRVGRPSSVTEQQKEEVKKLLMQEPPLSIAQISRETGVPKTTCFRIRTTMKEEQESKATNPPSSEES